MRIEKFAGRQMRWMIYGMRWWERRRGSGTCVPQQAICELPPPSATLHFPAIVASFFCIFPLQQQTAAPINGSHGFAMAVADFSDGVASVAAALLLQFAYFYTIFNAATH